MSKEGFFHVLKKGMFSGNEKTVDPAFESVKADFLRLNEQCMKLRQTVGTYTTSMKTLFESSKTVCEAFNDLLEDAPRPHPYQNMLKEHRNSRQEMCSEGRGMGILNVALDGTVLKKLTTEIELHKTLLERINERSKLVEELDYYNKKVADLIVEKEKRTSKGKEEKPAEMEKLSRNQTKQNDLKMAYTSFNDLLIADLTERWTARVKTLGPALTDFIAVEKQVLKVYSTAVKVGREPQLGRNDSNGSMGEAEYSDNNHSRSSSRSVAMPPSSKPESSNGNPFVMTRPPSQSISGAGNPFAPTPAPPQPGPPPPQVQQQSSMPPAFPASIAASALASRSSFNSSQPGASQSQPQQSAASPPPPVPAYGAVHMLKNPKESYTEVRETAVQARDAHDKVTDAHAQVTALQSAPLSTNSFSAVSNAASASYTAAQAANSSHQRIQGLQARAGVGPPPPPAGNRPSVSGNPPPPQQPPPQPSNNASAAAAAMSAGWGSAGPPMLSNLKPRPSVASPPSSSAEGQPPPHVRTGSTVGMYPSLNNSSTPSPQPVVTPPPVTNRPSFFGAAMQQPPPQPRPPPQAPGGPPPQPASTVVSPPSKSYNPFADEDESF